MGGGKVSLARLETSDAVSGKKWNGGFGNLTRERESDRFQGVVWKGKPKPASLGDRGEISPRIF
jgi:hypothetical protein